MLRLIVNMSDPVRPRLSERRVGSSHEGRGVPKTGISAQTNAHLNGDFKQPRRDIRRAAETKGHLSSLGELLCLLRPQGFG